MSFSDSYAASIGASLVFKDIYVKDEECDLDHIGTISFNVSHNAYSESEKSTPAHAGPGMCPVLNVWSTNARLNVCLWRDHAVENVTDGVNTPSGRTAPWKTFRTGRIPHPALRTHAGRGIPERDGVFTPS